MENRFQCKNVKKKIFLIWYYNTPGTVGGPGGRDRTLAVKSKKIAQKSGFFREKIKINQKKYFFCIYLLVMPKYWGKQISPRSGSKAKDGERRGEKD